MKSFIIMVLLVFFVAIPAWGIQRSGHDLLVDCRNLAQSESMDQVTTELALGMGYCIGLIDGLITFNYVYEAILEGTGDDDLIQLCLPEQVSTRQLAQDIVVYLEAHQDRLQESGQALAAQALVAAHGCGRGQTP